MSNGRHFSGSALFGLPQLLSGLKMLIRNFDISPIDQQGYIVDRALRYL